MALQLAEPLLCKYTLGEIIHVFVLREYRNRAVLHQPWNVYNI